VPPLCGTWMHFLTIQSTYSVLVATTPSPGSA
jgi:hypothetical protein